MYFAILILGFLTLFLHSLHYHLFRKKFPGPFAWPLVGNLPNFLLYSNGDMTSFLERYDCQGALVELWLPHRVLIVNSVRGAEEVLEQKSSNFVLRPGSDEALRFVGAYHSGVALNNNVEKWKMCRSLYQKGLHNSFLQQVPSVVLKKWQLLRGRIPHLADTNGVIDILDLSRRLITDVIGELTLGLDFGACRGELPEIVTLVNDYICLLGISLFEPHVWKNPFNSRVRHLLAQNKRRSELLNNLVDKFMTKEITSDAYPSFIELICRSAKDANSPLSRQELAQTVMDMIIGGTDTSVNTTSYTFLLLGEYQTVQNQLRDDLAKWPAEEFWKPGRASYAEKVLRDSMRLKPTLPYVARCNIADDSILSKAVPAGTMVLTRVVPAEANFMFDRPESFDPITHFPGEDYEAKLKRTIYPFGGGVRKCPGMQLAMVEMKVILSCVLQDYSIECCRGLTLKSLGTTFSLVQRPIEPVWVKLTPRISSN
jgi:cytochrome P450